MAQTEEQISNFRAYVIGGASKGSMGGSSPAKKRRGSFQGRRLPAAPF